MFGIISKYYTNIFGSLICQLCSKSQPVKTTGKLYLAAILDSVELEASNVLYENYCILLIPRHQSVTP